MTFSRGSTYDIFIDQQQRLAGGCLAGGLGLGLAIVRDVVALHEGRVEARSDGPDRGAVFTVTLPVIGGAGGNGDP